MEPQAELLSLIEAFLAERRIAETTFGRLAVNDGKFVGRLRSRQNMTLGTMERARSFIASERERLRGADEHALEAPSAGLDEAALERELAMDTTEQRDRAPCCLAHLSILFLCVTSWTGIAAVGRALAAAL